MILAALVFKGSSWGIVALITVLILVPLAWISWTRGVRRRKSSLLSRFLRIFALALLALALMDPQWTDERPSKGENIVALIIDNSAGLQLIDTNETFSRGERAKQALLKQNPSWLSELQESYQVRFYQFDEKLKRIQDLSTLDFTGKQSNLDRALQQLETRFQRQPLAAVVALSDGIVGDLRTDSPEPAYPFPVFTVPLGNKEPIPDARIGDLNIKQTAFDDTPLQLKARIQIDQLDASRELTAAVERIETDSGYLSSNTEDSVPRDQSITSKSGSDSRNLEFEWRPTDSGIQFYKIGLQSAEEALDRTPQNDQRIFMVDRGKKRFRILYVSGRPNWEYKFLNRALAPDPQLEMVALMRVARREPKFEFKGRAGESSNPLYRGFGRGDGDVERYDQPVLVRLNTRDEEELRGGFPGSAEELFDYDAIILDDLEVDFFNYNQLSLLRRFVSERGGGLLLLGGAESLKSGGYQGSPLAAALPVYLDQETSIKHGARLKWNLTREGWVEPWIRIHPNETRERERIETMPPFKVLNALPHIKPGARALAIVEDENGASFPGIVAQNFGAGKTACVAVGDLWRWAMQGPKPQAELAKQWRQIARWLVSDAPQRVEAKAERKSDGSIQIRIQAKDNTFQALDLGQAKIEIERHPIDQTNADSSSTQFSKTTLTAQPVFDSPGQFSAAFAGKDAGAYTARITVTDSEGLVIGQTKTGWVEEPAWAEFQTLTPDRQRLARLAQNTGGEMLEVPQLDQLAEKVAANPAPISETYASPLWHKSGIFLVILACLLAEWALRRKQGLA